MSCSVAHMVMIGGSQLSNQMAKRGCCIYAVMRLKSQHGHFKHDDDTAWIRLNYYFKKHESKDGTRFTKSSRRCTGHCCRNAKMHLMA